MLLFNLSCSSFFLLSSFNELDSVTATGPSSTSCFLSNSMQSRERVGLSTKLDSPFLNQNRNIRANGKSLNVHLSAGLPEYTQETILNNFLPLQSLIAADDSQGTLGKVLSNDVYRPIFFMGLALTFAGIVSTYIVGTLIDIADADEALLGEFTNERELLEREVDLNERQTLEEIKQKEIEINKKFENPTDDIYNINNKISANESEMTGDNENGKQVMVEDKEDENGGTTKKILVNDFED